MVWPEGGPAPAHGAFARRVPGQNSFDLGAVKDWAAQRRSAHQFKRCFDGRLLRGSAELSLWLFTGYHSCVRALFAGANDTT
jgi:hypothetical protein